MAYTKKFGSHAKVLIDDVDVSNAFSEFALASEHAQEGVGGFSVSGKEEFLAGLTTQGFTGTAFNTKELMAIIGPLHFNKTVCTISYQPQGLVDATREIYYGECQIMTFGPVSTFGAVETLPFAASTADADGIRVSNWT